MNIRPALLAASLVVGTTQALAQPAANRGGPLRLRDVITAMDTAGYDGRARRADTRAADADVAAARAGFLPSLRVETGAARTTDPIGVFGAKLRQRIVTPADFDPARLNHPEALTVTSGAVVLEQPVFAASAWLGRRAAQFVAKANGAASERADEHARLTAAQRYADAVLANASLAALDAAVEAGQAHVRQAATLETNGIVTHSDVLLANVRLRELEADRASARGHTVLARLALAALMAQPGDTTRALGLALPSTDALLAEADAASVDDASIAAGPGAHARSASTADRSGAAALAASRGDVRAAQFGVQAARANAQRATAQWLPTVGAVVRSDWTTAGQPFGGSPYWTAGLMVSLPVFSGGSNLADRQRALAQVQAAESRADGAVAMAELDATQTRIERGVAAERLRLAEDGLAQSREALRLVRRRYDGGLAAITELLDAGAASTHAQLTTEQARRDLLVALIAERVALGLDLAPILALDP